jgi:hypothetical protein
VAGIIFVPAEKAQDVRWGEVIPANILGFSGGKKNPKKLQVFFSDETSHA